jgi:hypothetical protein
LTNKEAIEIVEDIGFYVPLLDFQKEAIKIVIHDAKNWNEMINNIPHCTDYKPHSCEEIGEGLHKIIAEIDGGHGGYGDLLRADGALRELEELKRKISDNT